MADNFQITQGSGTTISAADTGGGILEQKIQVTSIPGVAITNFPSSQAVTGPLTDAQLRLTPVPISGTVTTTPTGTQAISGAVSVSNFPGSQPVTGTFFQATQPINGTVQISGAVNPTPAVLSVTATGAAAAAVTLTIPAVASNFHYITLLEIQAYSTAARTGTATPVVVTSSNLPGSNAWTFASAGAIGTTDARVFSVALPIRSAVSNTATTIVCPATTAVIWRVNVFYYTAV